MKAANLPADWLEADLLLCDLLGWERHRLVLEPDRELNIDQIMAYEDRIRRRLNGEPVQYILGHREFMGLSFCVSTSVLIPRVETETLAEHVLSFVKGRCRADLLDIGTGSGALAVSLAHFLPDARVTAVDISPKALAVAQKNARRHGVSDRIRFLCGDLTAPLKGPYRADVLVSNPPYIPTGALSGLMREVADFEPRIALDGGADGLTFYRRLVHEGVPFIRPGGLLALEIGCDQGQAVSALLKDSGLFCKVSLLQDLSGLDRVVSGITHY